MCAYSFCLSKRSLPPSPYCSRARKCHAAPIRGLLCSVHCHFARRRCGRHVCKRPVKVCRWQRQRRDKAFLVQVQAGFLRTRSGACDGRRGSTRCKQQRAGKQSKQQARPLRPHDVHFGEYGNLLRLAVNDRFVPGMDVCAGFVFVCLRWHVSCSCVYVRPFATLPSEIHSQCSACWQCLEQLFTTTT